MAPEVFRTKSYNEKCDIYSFGIILWEILSRKKPYEEIEELYRLLWLVANGLRPPLDLNCPEVLEQLMVRSWDDNVSNRPDINYIVDLLEKLFDFYIDERDMHKSTKLFIPTESPTSSQNSSPQSSILSSDVLYLTRPLDIDIIRESSFLHNSSALEVCGHGNFGQIRIARWKGELVATKSFNLKQNFHAEIKNFPRDKHPNIIKLFGICPKHSLLVLEYAEIGSLHHSEFFTCYRSKETAFLILIVFKYWKTLFLGKPK